MKNERIPELTHLQFLVLEILGSGAMTGQELRKQLKQHGVDKGGPAFYQMMARLEKAKMAKGWYTQEIIDGQIIKARNYQVLGNGIKALRQAVEFYQPLVASHKALAYG